MSHRRLELLLHDLDIALLVLAKRVAAISKHGLEVVLGPADLGVESRKLPHAVDLLVPVHVVAVRVALDGDRLAARVRVLLVRHAQLVVPDDLRVRYLLPARAADEVLRLEQRVAEDRLVADHGDELLGRHGLPDLVEEGAVVDLVRDVSLMMGFGVVIVAALHRAAEERGDGVGVVGGAQGGREGGSWVGSDGLGEMGGGGTYAELWGDALAETVPVLGVVGVGPLEEAGRQAEVVCRLSSVSALLVVHV